MQPPTEKDPLLLRLLEAVADALRGAPLVLVDHWDGDFFAIGIAAEREPNRLVYVSTLQQASGHCFIECETPDDSEAGYASSQTEKSVPFARAVEIIRQHLRLEDPRK